MNTNTFRRALVGAWLLALYPGASAALTCEQLFAVVQEAVRYRDQGYSLSQVLTALKGVEAENKLTKAELDLLHKSVSASYLSQASPEEITLECVNSGVLGKPKNADSRRD
ncbi:MAG: hypothetical protein EHM59_08675 [Betaproteobacteria bacterium]|nr:MAG: hypothetical protein EHM59_08675 [Betaproteobacteria bacterium]